MNPFRQAEYNARRFRLDWIAKRVITVFGCLVLAMFVLIIWHIFSNAMPLLKSPSIQVTASFEAPENTQFLGTTMLDNGQFVLAKQQCALVLSRIQAEKLLPVKRFPFSCAKQFVHIDSADKRHIALLSQSGLLEIYRLEQSNNSVHLNLVTSVAVSPRLSDLQDWQVSINANQVVAIFFEAQRQVVQRFALDTDVIPAEQVFTSDQLILIPGQQQLVSKEGPLLRFIDANNEVVDQKLFSRPLRYIQVGPLGRSLYTLDEDQQFSKWSLLNEAGKFIFVSHPEQQSKLLFDIKRLAFDPHSNAGLIFYQEQKVAFFNRATHQVFSWRDLSVDIQQSVWNNGRVYAINDTGNVLSQLQVQDIQGITTWQSLFGTVNYQGYADPQYVWQTSSASEFYEAKHSVVPLIIGSLKASVLALIVAIPLALGAAIYTSFFASAQVRDSLKPSIEMLEAVPSVVIGFIAAVWLAPLAEQFLLSILLFILLLPLFLIATALIQPTLASFMQYRSDKRWELLYIIAGSVFLAAACVALGDVWQSVLQFDDTQSGVFKLSKSSIVVAIALGVAISPSIYSLADDALHEVPNGMKSAAFALGATPLQTLRSVVLVVALPSILSAVMLGFGRAFGETMIVLMVTGNTPISSWDIFDGLRAMTANLAIELQESQVGSTHFNVLFLTASMLFLFTFVVNTGAELLRRRLRISGQHD